MTAIALTIAGSDSGGGAGIQADIKTFSALGAYGASVITAVTAQNTKGITAVADIEPVVIAAQIDAVLSDLDVAAVKIGMVSRRQTITTIAGCLRGLKRPVVLDPVMVATSGDQLLQEDAVAILREELLPLALLATPNLPEAAVLTGTAPASNRRDIAQQAEAILKLGARAVLIKGGHSAGPISLDFLFEGNGVHEFPAPRIDTSNDHGTGCTLAAAITAHLALGHGLAEAVGRSKDYLHCALSAGRHSNVGKGRGPMHHFFRWWPA